MKTTWKILFGHSCLSPHFLFLANPFIDVQLNQQILAQNAEIGSLKAVNYLIFLFAVVRTKSCIPIWAPHSLCELHRALTEQAQWYPISRHCLVIDLILADCVWGTYLRVAIKFHALSFCATCFALGVISFPLYFVLYNFGFLNYPNFSSYFFRGIMGSQNLSFLQDNK